jgi:hypothetical protein
VGGSVRRHLGRRSMLRTQKWLETGVQRFDNKKPVSMPISFWRDDDIWGISARTTCPTQPPMKWATRGGLCFCMFGVTSRMSHRFQASQKTHPKLCDIACAIGRRVSWAPASVEYIGFL